ncbi:MAG: patatin-like phospholipase family protein [Eubacteriales bacterium]|nr:patatin-like phospholipase family protein [Eubacteriales bacterium]
MYGVVFGGGGARGAYEVGAWRAIMEQDIKVGAICGTSIGSINAAIFAQGDYELAEEVWRNISTSDVVDMSTFSDKKLMSVKNIGALVEEMRKNKGISLEPLEKLLRSIIDENKLLLSPVDFGLLTYSLSDNAVVELFKSDIPKGMLVDYLMASSCLPGTKARIIGDKTFVDGGLVDNKPIVMLTKKGYRNIISIDVGGYGLVRQYVPDGVNVIEVKCKNPIVGILDFDTASILDTIEAGYLDTKRAFGKLTGEIYSIRMSDYLRSRRKYSADIILGLEKAADIFGINKLKEYTVISLARAVLKAYRKVLSEEQKSGFEKLTSPSMLFTAVCASMTEGGKDVMPRIAVTAFKKYSMAANAVCYFDRNM